MNPPVGVDGWRRFRNRVILLTLSLFCGAYSIIVAIVLPTSLFPELQDPILALHETASITEGTYLCQHWHRDGKVGGWATGANPARGKLVDSRCR